MNDFAWLDIRRLYDAFDEPVTPFDCGLLCAPYNPHKIPFCCDICHAVPVAYHQEWEYLQHNTDLWHAWRGDECLQEPIDPGGLRGETPQHLTLLACLGPAHCQRPMRATSCRQFPFFPYITSDDRFLGLAYEWEFETTCWVISHLEEVTQAYRHQFMEIYDELFLRWEDEYESYAGCSELMREHFTAHRRRIPLLHRNGGFYLISPGTERMVRVSPESFRGFEPYKNRA
jgi:hypothetical protein